MSNVFSQVLDQSCGEINSCTSGESTCTTGNIFRQIQKLRKNVGHLNSFGIWLEIGKSWVQTLAPLANH